MSPGSTEATAQLAAKLEALRPDWQGQISDIRYLSGGYSNHNYRFTVHDSQYVVRCGHGVDRQRAGYLDLPAQQRISQALHRVRIEQAPVVHIDPVAALFVTRYVAAPLLVDEPRSPDELAAYLRHLHNRLRNVRAEQTYDSFDLACRWLPEARRRKAEWRGHSSALSKGAARGRRRRTRERTRGRGRKDPGATSMTDSTS